MSVNITFCFSTKTLNELERIILIGFSSLLSLFPPPRTPLSFFKYFATLPSLNPLLKVRVNHDGDVYW